MKYNGFLQCIYRIRNISSDFNQMQNGVPSGMSKQSFILKLKKMDEYILKAIKYLENEK